MELEKNLGPKVTNFYAQLHNFKIYPQGNYVGETISEFFFGWILSLTLVPIAMEQLHRQVK